MKKQSMMFLDGSDLPLFSGVPQRATVDPFVPSPVSTLRQLALSEVHDVSIALADKGIFAMYGGRKGHGFWLYQTTPEQARSLIDRFDPSVDLSGKCIKNDGKRSGNECFWMFSDAVKLAESK